MDSDTDRIPVDRVARSRRPGLDLGKLAFGAEMSDHMLVAAYQDGAWQAPRIRPYGALPLAPSISALQYGLSVFEGLKAQRSPDGRTFLFRPGENARRMIRSAERFAMPPVGEETFVEGLRALVRTDEQWVPPSGAGALYIRPCLFSVDPSVRVKPAEKFLFVVFTFPFGAYYADPVDALVTERYVRAFPGGTGNIKPAGNYAPALIADKEAAALGCQTVLWLDGKERRYVEECGVMNVFFVVGDAVLTPELGGTILPGVTRDSAIALLRRRGLAVEERRIDIAEIVAAWRRGELRECFGTGTAATLTQIKRIRFRDLDLVLPPAERWKVGPSVRDELGAIATGRAPDVHGWLVEV